jgi:hypothetical protein
VEFWEAKPPRDAIELSSIGDQQVTVAPAHNASGLRRRSQPPQDPPGTQRRAIKKSVEKHQKVRGTSQQKT